MRHTVRPASTLWKNSKVWVVASLCLLTTGVVMAPRPALAQDGAAAPMNSGQKRDSFLDQQLAPQVPRDFEGALASVGEFLEANPDLDKWDQVRLISAAGYRLYFLTPAAKRSKVADSALGLLDGEIQNVKTRDNGDPDFQSWEIRELFNNKIKILLGEKRAPEAAKVLEQWRALRPSFQDDVFLDDSFVWGENWRAVQHQQGQPTLAVSGLVAAFEEGLLRRRTFARGTVTNIIDELLEQGKTEEARSWAKLGFALCPFEEGAIRDATRDVARCLTAGEMSLGKANQFAAAQTDPAAPNPLDKVALPQFDKGAIRAQLADAADKSSFETRLIEALAIGDYRAAMILAKSQLVSDVTNQNTALQVARVFKAKDGDIVRANQFLAYYQVGEGDNPIPAFLKETEADAPGN